MDGRIEGWTHRWMDGQVDKCNRKTRGKELENNTYLSHSQPATRPVKQVKAGGSHSADRKIPWPTLRGKQRGVCGLPGRENRSAVWVMALRAARKQQQNRARFAFPRNSAGKFICCIPNHMPLPGGPRPGPRAERGQTPGSRPQPVPWVPSRNSGAPAGSLEL